MSQTSDPHLPGPPGAAPRRPSKWIVPAISIILGLALAVPTMLRGEIWLGAAFMLIMVGMAAWTLLARRGPDVGPMLAGEGTDERQRSIYSRADTVVSNVLILVLVGGLLVTIGMGHEAALFFGGMCAVAGVTWPLSVVYYTKRG